MVKLVSIRVRNFKAVRDALIPLSDGLTVLVGENSSGKSSVLQAIHWACRCIAHPRAQRNQSRSIAAHDFDFYPTEQVRKVGHNRELRQGRGPNREVSVRVSFEHGIDDDAPVQESTVKLSQGNNDVIKIDLQNDLISSDLYELMSNRDRPFSSYIPGLAGIPLAEEKRSRLPILRQAASGDANAVLRNILLQIKESNDPQVSLERLSELCSEVLDEVDIQVNFSEGRDFLIDCTLRTHGMHGGYFTPLELAGTGVLQCIQIFSYLILYRPKILLIDEPDAHLHPSRQEDLIAVLSRVAKEYESSVILTTHSPNLVKALPESANVVWMKDGGVIDEGDAVRQKMGWGILDKRIIIITEDSKPEELRSLIKQWPELERQIAIWPVNGHTALPNKDACEALLSMTGAAKILVHRDGDFMTPSERDKMALKYDCENVSLWITDFSDVESFFLQPERIASVSGLELPVIREVFSEIRAELQDRLDDDFVAKRQMLAEDRRLYAHRDQAPKVSMARIEINKGPDDFGIIKGKTFSKKLKQEISQRGGDTSNFLRIVEGEAELAISLREALSE
ncbi:hypothetical protein DKT77_15400 [Meridianimarinicoccus roseus]|uniref:AAA+ ATPase domain-containing protein n=2 Tax=Meridianimarinicoccus roseus TaxID=2072018 RepID=A0A2V2L7Y1_9RHOB|nr:hypothetical protein DKT77_15400 [Meridianimarinicoccus roseus]